jgi:hypothetical protein
MAAYNGCFVSGALWVTRAFLASVMKMVGSSSFKLQASSRDDGGKDGGD